jgi:glycosyltransferase involved in cell wall biosynthesis
MVNKNIKFYLGVILICLVVSGFLFFDTKISNDIQISDEKYKQLKYDTWEKYSDTKALEKPNAKSRTVMLLHGYTPFWNAGSEVCAHTVNKLLVEKGHEVWVGVPGYPNRIYEGVHIFNADNRILLHNLMLHTDVISTHSFRDRCIKLSEQYGTAYIDWLHGGTFTMAVRKSLKTHNKNRWAIFNCESLIESFTDAEEIQYHVLRPPVNWREYEVEERKPKYVTLSNLNENKGGHILIEIAKITPEVQFLGVRGSYWKQIEDNTVPNITYIDNTPKIKDVYAQTNILIMPSKEETWGRTAVEAMSSGIPVIASPTPGLKECCKDAALFVDRDDIQEWSRLIRRLISDDTFYQECSNRGKIRAKQLEPIHDLEVFQEWYENKVIPSANKTLSNPPTLLQKFLDLM